MIPIAKPIIGKEEEEAVIKVLRSGKLAQGEKVAEFEEKFANFVGTKYAVATDNGTTALMVALTAAGIGSGDEVITTPFTFMATATSVVFTGATPIFVDIDPQTFNLDPSKIEKAITKKTKAIMPVHLYGLMANMPEIMKIAKKHNLLVIEDSAQAHGANIGGRKAGSWGIAGTFSFYPTKNMTTGEGGMITTNDENLAKKARIFRNQGMQKRYVHEIVGYNFRMTNIAAAIGIEQLKKLEALTEKRIKNAEFLTKKLQTVRGLTTPVVPEGYRHVFHQYTIRTNDREGLIRKLEEAQIGYGIYYPGLVQNQEAFADYGEKVDTTIAEKACQEVISLPVNPTLTAEELATIVEVVKG